MPSVLWSQHLIVRVQCVPVSANCHLAPLSINTQALMREDSKVTISALGPHTLSELIGRLVKLKCMKVR